jgi:hypothetical protein
MTAFAERQTYSAAALLELAEQRLDAGELDALEQIVESFLAAPVTNDPACSFDRAFWTATGKGTRNRIYMREILWYFNLIEREPRFGESLFADPVTRAHSGVDTVGSEKSGMVEPPVRTFAVPVGEMNTRLEFDESAVTQGIWQNVTVGSTSVGVEHGPEVTCPLESNRKMIGGEVTSGDTMFVVPRLTKSTILVSVARSRAPFWS